MKIKFIVASFLTLMNLSYAVDLSKDTNLEQTIKKEQSMTVKQSQENRETSRQTETFTNEMSLTQEISFNLYPIFVSKTKDCLQNPKLIDYYGVSSFTREGIDVTRRNFMEQSALSNSNIKVVGMDDKKFKNDLICIATESAKMAQASLNFSKNMQSKKPQTQKEILQLAKDSWSNNLDDMNLLMQIDLIKNSLDGECKFYHSLDSIKCKSISYDFTTSTMNLLNMKINSYESQFGISSDFKTSIVSNNSNNRENSVEDSTTKARDTSMNTTKTNNKSQGSKTVIDTQKFVPAQ